MKKNSESGIDNDDGGAVKQVIRENIGSMHDTTANKNNKNMDVLIDGLYRLL
eukprot:CAMPEP_0113515602 /NCGR_PEP_ID=MMETSP0014_2-20120614/41080_1 /TAXON_ID=2857 /ORGANISM="Nitzschia sp." /LENGTH=51 /DNA_ID=CAMNT_0000412277 /DNA_START=86 /DNA_END=238 /DNA_ORIENTATION=- /assembly_acc=CAM_ASM_000159